MQLPLQESVAMYNHGDNMTVLSKRVKTKKYVTILTSVHFAFSYVEDNKTEAHMFYNGSKGGVDAFDAMCAFSGTGRKTRRWPVAMFYGILDIAMNNAFIISRSLQITSNSDRHEFNGKLAYQLARPFAEHKLATQGKHFTPLKRELLKATFGLTNVDVSAADTPVLCPGRKVSEGPLRHRCRLCENKCTWRGKDICNGCQRKGFCKKHSVVYCEDCWRSTLSLCVCEQEQ